MPSKVEEWAERICYEKGAYYLDKEKQTGTVFDERSKDLVLAGMRRLLEEADKIAMEGYNADLHPLHPLPDKFVSMHALKKIFEDKDGS